MHVGGLIVKLIQSSSRLTLLCLGSLLLIFDLTTKKGFGRHYTNWSGTRATLLMSLRQGETSQHRALELWCGRLGPDGVWLRPPPWAVQLLERA